MTPGSALASTGPLQVANWFVGAIMLGRPSGDLQLTRLVTFIALARARQDLKDNNE